MAVNQKSNKGASLAQNPNVQPAGIYFEKYSESYQTPAQKIIHWVSMIVIIFSLLGLFWAIPFPYLKFLGQYNGFFNWASFLIAAGVYYYYKKAPTLSYIVFLLFFACSYFVMQLDNLHKSGGPALWLVCGVLFIVFASLQFSNLKIKNKKPSFSDGLNFMIISPLWVLHFLFKRKTDQ